MLHAPCYVVWCWNLTNSLQKLESSQGELAKRILKRPIHSLVAYITFGRHSLHSVCTIRKLKLDFQDHKWSLLQNLFIFSRWCRIPTFGKGVQGTWRMTQVRLHFKASDNRAYTGEATNHHRNGASNIRRFFSERRPHSTFSFARLQTVTLSWKMLWDCTLDQGGWCITDLRNFVKIITYLNHAVNKCLLWKTAEFNGLLPEHLLTDHTNTKYPWDIYF